MWDIITSALGQDGALVRIEQAIIGMRYRGIGHHEPCQLYPVNRREGKRSSFAHIPNRSHCMPPSGESAEHEMVKMQWAEFLHAQLIGCFICVHIDRESPHRCPSVPSASPHIRPAYGTVAWVCDACLKPHIYDILRDAKFIAIEEWQFDRSVRPDITILNKYRYPLAFIEFKKSNLSEVAERVARERDIPLFVVGILDGVSSQNKIHNSQYRWYDNATNMEPADRDLMRRLDSVPRSGSEFNAIFDDDGNLIDATLHYSEDPGDDSVASNMPVPKAGTYLLAERSTLLCDSQRQDLLEPF